MSRETEFPSHLAGTLIKPGRSATARTHWLNTDHTKIRNNCCKVVTPILGLQRVITLSRVDFSNWRIKPSQHPAKILRLTVIRIWPGSPFSEISGAVLGVAKRIFRPPRPPWATIALGRAQSSQWWLFRSHHEQLAQRGARTIKSSAPRPCIPLVIPFSLIEL